MSRFDQNSKGVVYRLRIAKDCGDVRIKEHNIGAFHVLSVVLAPNTFTEVVFRPNFMVIHLHTPHDHAHGFGVKSPRPD